MKQEAGAGEEQMSPMRARTLAESFRYAFAGVAYAFCTQRNLRIHGAVAVLVLLLAWAVGVTGGELALLVLTIGVVVAAELFNTAVEATVDLVTDTYQPLAAVAKNVAAGAVLALAGAAVVIGYLVFAPHLPPVLAALPPGGFAAAVVLAPPAAIPRKVMTVQETGEGTVPGLSAAEADRLVAAAQAVRERAYVPYSGFKVGAALLTASGHVIAGCNVENASYGATLCAERVALGAAVAAGHREFRAIAVVTDGEEPATPCGICRQSLVEFAPDLPVILANLRGQRRVTTASQLLPGAFHLPGAVREDRAVGGKDT